MLDEVRVSVFVGLISLVITRKTFSLTLHYALDEAYTSG